MSGCLPTRFMALLTPDDIQQALNIDLTNPQGQELATALIAASTAFVTKALGYPVEKTSVTTYFDGEFSRLWLPTGAPVSSLVISTYNSLTNDYEDIDTQYVRNQGTAEVYISTGLPRGFQTVRASYTTGWTSENLPDDLRQALIELVGLKIQEVANFSSNPDDPTGDESGAPTGALKRVQSGSVTLEYAATANDTAWKAKAAQLSRSIGDDVPAHILHIFNSYRRPFAV